MDSNLHCVTASAVVRMTAATLPADSPARRSKPQQRGIHSSTDSRATLPDSVAISADAQEIGWAIAKAYL